MTSSPQPDTEQASSGLTPEVEWWAALIIIGTPLLGIPLAIWTHTHHPVGALELGLWAGFHVVTTLGVTAGFHRHFTHKSFGARQLVRWVMGITGSMANQGPLFHWVQIHRLHHSASETADDPHSPWAPRGGLRGFLHAHVGWNFEHHPEDEGYQRRVRDLRDDPLCVSIDKTYFLWVLIGLLIPAGIAGAVYGTWIGALSGLAWGGLIRIAALHQLTYGVNSICHMVGTRPHETGDKSVNNVVWGLLGFGEGWHNNHHAFPASARHGLRWWQLDVTWILLRVLAAVGLVHGLILPPESAQSS